MQSRRWQHHRISGELDVFGATSYFAGGRVDWATAVAQPAATAADRVTQQQRMAERFLGHDDEQHVEVHDLHHEKEEMDVDQLAKPAGKSNNLAAFFFGFFMVSSSSPGASFRRRPPPLSSPPTSTKSTPAGGDESVNASSRSSAAPARRSTGNLTARSSSSDDADDVQLEGRVGGCYALNDLGVATGDRRLQGVKVVSSGANQQETWVVRCTPACWDHHQDKFDAASLRNHYYVVDQVEEEEDCTASHSSSDLFDLDIESVDL